MTYTSVKQGPLEPYTALINRLTQALERQCEGDEARPLLLRNLAYANANEECRKVIRSLPEQEPTLPQMIEACSKTGSPQQIATIQAATYTKRQVSFKLLCLFIWQVELQKNCHINWLKRTPNIKIYLEKKINIDKALHNYLVIISSF